MNRLVIHDPSHTFIGGERFVGIAEGGDTYANEIRRDTSGGPVSVVSEVLYENGDALRRCVVKQIFFELESVLKGADQVRDKILVGGRVIQNFYVLGGLDVKLWKSRKARRREKQKEPGEFPQGSVP
jgi:hypothetical protein